MLGYFLNTRFNLDAKPVSLLFLRGEKGLELLKRNVLLVRLPLKAHYLVLERLYSQGDSLRALLVVCIRIEAADPRVVRLNRLVDIDWEIVNEGLRRLRPNSHVCRYLEEVRAPR